MRAGADIDRERGRRAITPRRRAGGTAGDLAPHVAEESDHDAWAEIRHDALAALLGIEAAAQSLSRHRHLLSAGQVDELAGGLVAEVDRLRALLAGRSRAPGASAPQPATVAAVDLRDAVMPVVVCARSLGQSVKLDVPAGTLVSCDREVVARALLSLLSNARRHAPGSPVEVRASVRADVVELRVEDRGPGVPAALRARLFEWGARSPVGGGSGVGLHTARKLLSEQGGTIRHVPRPGGGATFLVSLLRAAADAPGPVAPVARMARADRPGGPGGAVPAGGPAGGMTAAP
ncbi:MAG TPA: HAMP domain-containing sensor histidine kinase [Acidimicrobiales bacterium]